MLAVIEKTNSNKTKINEVVPILMLFLVNCFLGWTLFTLYLCKNINKKNILLIWSLLTIIFISLYNATKIPENDLEWYVDYYLAAEKMSFENYLTMLNGGKEQLYQVLVYGIYLIGGRNFHIYIFSISFISYICLLRTLYIMKKQLKMSNGAFVGAVGFLCFFPYTFAISVHIVRQVLASSIIIWLLFEYYSGSHKKRFLFFALATIFIHTSAIFILPFFFIKQITKPLSKKNIWLYISIVLIIFSISYIGGQLMAIATSDSAAGYIANKMANGTTFDTTLPLSHLLLSVFFVIGGYISIYNHRNKMQTNVASSLILHIATILLIFILANANNPELQLRCNFFFWTYASLFVLIYLVSYDIRLSQTMLLLLVLFIFWNIYNTYLSQWIYTCSSYYYLYPFFLYFY